MKDEATPEPQQPADWVDDRELAERTPLSRPMWAKMRQKKKGPPFYRVGKRCLYRWIEVLAWLETKRTEPEREQQPEVARRARRRSEDEIAAAGRGDQRKRKAG